MALTDTAARQSKYDDSKNGRKLTDGGGLYLHVMASGKYWRMAYRMHNKQKILALGVYPAVTLAQARKGRDEARAKLAQGIDPGEAKRESKALAVKAAANTFEAVAREWLVKTANQRKPVTHAKVLRWLEKEILPSIGRRPISSLKPRDVLAIARTFELRGALESAHRVQQLCGQIFRYAVAADIMEHDVTQDLRGAIATPRKKHHSAITNAKRLGDLLRAIEGAESHPYCVAALKLSALTFVRPGELRYAQWDEFDLEGAMWSIPAERMKMGQPHSVPLSTQAIAVLRQLHSITGHLPHALPNIRTPRKPMSENTVNAALRTLGFSGDEHTAHGFRATARTLMDEELGERVDLIEHQLAHAVRDANGRAYNRTAHLPERRKMMQRWADYLDKLRTGADIIPMPAKVA